VQLCKLRAENGVIQVGCIDGQRVFILPTDPASRFRSLSEILHSDDPLGIVRELAPQATSSLDLDSATLLAPIDLQEVWGAGVTYRRSREARERESVGAARFYDLAYSAPRPELFFKAPAYRVVGPGGTIRVRRDSKWTVPEPEMALVISPAMKVVGFTIGNDVSARDIEGENPLYLPQAKIYTGACALGPTITLSEVMPPPDQVAITMRIEREGKAVFEGSTSAGALHRSLEELVNWLGQECDFPQGIILLTGTGIVPNDEFALQAGDLVEITMSGIGRLVNRVR
jgi:2-dehydro-3-deoxy-D-arabinonate dehydratase